MSNKTTATTTLIFDVVAVSAVGMTTTTIVEIVDHAVVVGSRST